MSDCWLLLVRHAKSSWKEALPDFERPLNRRGMRDGPRMAVRVRELLQRSGRTPDLLLSSPAVRAAATARLFASELDAQSRLAFDPALYHADAQTIIERVRCMPAQAETVLLFGHNPGLADAAAVLCPDSPEHLPTAGVVVLAGQQPGWKGLASGCRLELFDYPKRIAA